MNKRQIYNTTLCHLLRELVDKYPDLRFSQILLNFDFTKKDVDDYYLEPWELEERIIETINKVNTQ